MTFFEAFSDEMEKLAAPTRRMRLRRDPHPWARRTTSRKFNAIKDAIITGIGGGIGGGVMGGPPGAVAGAAVGTAFGAGSGYGITHLERAAHARSTLGRMRLGGRDLRRADLKLIGESTGMSSREVKGAIKKMTRRAEMKDSKTYPVSRLATSTFDDPAEHRYSADSVSQGRIRYGRALKSRVATKTPLMKSERKLISEIKKHRPVSAKRLLKLIGIPATMIAGGGVGLHKLKGLSHAPKDDSKKKK